MQTLRYTLRKCNETILSNADAHVVHYLSAQNIATTKIQIRFLLRHQILQFIKVGIPNPLHGPGNLSKIGPGGE